MEIGKVETILLYVKVDYVREDEFIIFKNVVFYVDSIQVLLCSLTNNRENVSMGHFREIEIACTNISGIPES